MNEANALELGKKRDDLIARIARERSELVLNGTSMRPVVNWAGTLGAAVRFLGKHPQLLLVPAAMMALPKSRRLMGMAVSGLGLWRLVRKWRGAILK